MHSSEIFILQHELTTKGCVIRLNTSNSTFSYLISNVNFLFLMSIMIFVVVKSCHPRIIGMWASFSNSNTIKSTRMQNLPTLMGTFSITPLKYLIDLSINCRVTIVGFSSPISNLLHIDNGIRLILALRLHNVLLKDLFPIVHGIEKLHGSFSFSRSLF